MLLNFGPVRLVQEERRGEGLKIDLLIVYTGIYLDRVERDCSRTEGRRDVSFFMLCHLRLQDVGILCRVMAFRKASRTALIISMDKR